jgi:hypothetical protein
MPGTTKYDCSRKCRYRFIGGEAAHGTGDGHLGSIHCLYRQPTLEGIYSGAPKPWTSTLTNGRFGKTTHHTTPLPHPPILPDLPAVEVKRFALQGASLIRRVWGLIKLIDTRERHAMHLIEVQDVMKGMASWSVSTFLLVLLPLVL